MVRPDPQGYVPRLWGSDEALATDSATQWRLEIWGLDPMFNSYVTDRSISVIEQYGKRIVYNRTDVDSSRRVSTNGIKITDYYNKAESYEIGGSTSSEIELGFVNDDGYMNTFAWSWSYFFYAKCYDPINQIWITIPLGVYWFEKPEKLDGLIVHVKGYDDMQRLESISAEGLFDDIAFSEDPNETATLADIYEALVSLVNTKLAQQEVDYYGRFSGLPAAWDSLNVSAQHAINTTYPFFAEPFDASKYNARQVLEFIAGFTGRNAYVSRNGYIRLTGFADASYRQAGVTHYYTMDTTSGPTDVISLSKSEFTTPAIDRLDISIIDAQSVATEGTGDNRMIISGNPLFKSYDASTVVQNIYGVVSSLHEYTPMSIRCFICPTIEAGDIIRVVYGGTEYIVPIFQQTITWRGGPFMTEIVSSGLKFRQNEQSITSQIDEMSARIDTVESNYVPSSGGEFTGNVRFDGTVDVVQRRADASLSSTGWYNVIKFNSGTSAGVRFATAQVLKIRIGTSYSNTSNCTHDVTMLATYGTNPRFASELSRSNVNVIDKIRYRYDANNNGWIDVHYAASASNDVWMMFDVSAYNTTQAYWIAQNFVSVADAPSTGGTADTILTTYSFMDSTAASISFTPTSGSAYSSYGNCWYAKDGFTVHVHIGISGLTANTSTNIFTVPEGFRPKTLTVATGNGSSISTLARARISTAGVITVYSASTSALIDAIFICAL